MSEKKSYILGRIWAEVRVLEPIFWPFLRAGSIGKPIDAGIQAIAIASSLNDTVRLLDG